jgi:O-antigen/teichoic acid export membrane protein
MNQDNSTPAPEAGSNTVQAFWVALGSLSSLSLSLVSAAILSRYFLKEEYGTYKQILYVYNTLLVVFTAGLPNVFSYFLPRYPLAQSKEIVHRITWILAGLGLVFSLCLYIFADLIAWLLNNSELSPGLKVFSPMPLLLLPTLGIEGIFSTYRRAVYIAIYGTLTRIASLLCIVLPVIVWGGTYMSAIYGWIAGSLFTLVLALYMRSIPFKGVAPIPSDLKVKQILGYSLPIVIASIWGIVFRAADQFYISRYFGPAVYAEYSNGFIEIPFVGMITSAASTVLMPVFSSLTNQNDNEKIAQLFRSTLIKSATLIYPITVFFMFTGKELMTLLYSKNYVASGLYFQINILLNFFNIIIFGPLLLSLGKTKFYANLHVLAAFLSWVGGYILIQTVFSPISVSALTVAINILMVLLALFYSSKILNIKVVNLVPILGLLKMLIHCVLCLSLVKLVVMFWLPSVDSILYLIVIACSYAAIVLITDKWFFIDYLVALQPLFDKVKSILSYRNAN